MMMKSSINVRKKLSILFVFIIYYNLSAQTLLTDMESVSHFGPVYLYSKPVIIYDNLLILISDDNGWNKNMDGYARISAEMGYSVAGVDIKEYYKRLIQVTEDCFTISPGFIELATAIERKYKFHDYVPPFLMGCSSGATLVYGLLAQARAGTFAGGISLGFCPEIIPPKMLCRMNGLDWKVLEDKKSFLLLPDSRLRDPWIVINRKNNEGCDFKTVADFVNKTTNAKLILVPEPGTGISRWSDALPQLKSALNELIKKPLVDRTGNELLPDLKNVPYLPIKENVASDKKSVAILFSGDGGWYGFEQSISKHMGDIGIPMLGIDIKKYLWTRKTPEQCANDISALLKLFSKKWNKNEYILMGYSQGAEIVPFIFNRLPQDIRFKVSSIIMLSPEKNTDFEVHISNMLGIGNSQNTYDVLKEIRKISGIEQYMILGESEKSEMPQLLKASNIRMMFVPGDHHYHGNAELIVNKLHEAKAF